MTKTEFEAQTAEQRHAINPDASLADIGAIVSAALSHNEEGDADSVRDILFDLHSLIYPNSSYTATPEESMDRHSHIKEASVASIELCISETLDAYGPEDGRVLHEVLKEIHNYINYGVPMMISVTPDSKAYAAHTPPSISDSDITKKAQLEIKLLNLKSYARLIGCALEDTATGKGYKLPEDWRVMSGGTWNDCFVMLHHIEETLAELLPE